MANEKRIDIITDLLLDFDEMGFAPTTTVSDPDAYAIAWRNKLTEALQGYRKQTEGEWIDKPTGAYRRMQSWCSACGKHSGIGGIESNRHKPYCPNCGAKMRKEDEKNETH